MIGYFGLRVEVERLVHDAVEVGDAVVGLDPERLGILESGRKEGRDVGRLELEEQVAGRVAELRLGAASTREKLSMKNRAESFMDTACEASPLSICLRPEPSRPTR